ncbi:MAG: DUF4198 domain-containing protein, partial [Gemmatimonadota bacterium]|nr:DUF4198 domain-containing protein [Gemmatimonadota bacterium]
EEAAEYVRLGTLPSDSVTMRSAKFAKTIVEVGNGGAAAFDRLAGHGLEIVPLANPLALEPGSRAQFRVLSHGNPLPGVHVHAGVAAEAAGRPAVQDISANADANGIVTFRLERAGLWNVRVAHAEPSAPGTGADWDVQFATLVFSVGRIVRQMPFPTPVLSDSAAAAEVVMAFERAIAAGDSSGALRLLAPDAVILEAGEIQSRSDYAGHHLSEDIAFRKAVPAVSGPIRAVVAGDVAWVTSTSISKGEFEGRAINSAGAELMVLSRTNGAGSNGPAWRIRAIHWSSRRLAK